MNKSSQQYFDALRKQHFPPERNFLSAHLTLLHALPNGILNNVQDYLEDIARQNQPFSMEVTGVRNMGKGVAYIIRSEELQRLHSNMQDRWQAYLTPQDRQKLNPHITVQNKVSPAEAAMLYNQLKTTELPQPITATGFDLWYYMGGPWQKIDSYTFA